MYEIQHFFTPILDQLVSFDDNDWYLSPIVNLPLARKTQEAEKLEPSIVQLNACFDRLQKLAEDFVTVSLCGRKAARSFMLKVQEKLAKTGLLSYNAQMRGEILAELHISISDFSHFRSFAKVRLQEMLYQFHEAGLFQTPASLVWSPQDTLAYEACSQKKIQKLLKTA